jgi:hypothetical protein
MTKIKLQDLDRPLRYMVITTNIFMTVALVIMGIYLLLVFVGAGVYFMG